MTFFDIHIIFKIGPGGTTQLPEGGPCWGANIKPGPLFMEVRHMSSDVINIISTIGFPIFSFLLCGYALKYVYDKERQSLDEAINKIGSLTMAVEHNSEAIRDLAAKMTDHD